MISAAACSTSCDTRASCLGVKPAATSLRSRWWGIVHVDHPAEELEELGGQVRNARRAATRAEDVGPSTGFQDVGVAGHRPVAVADRDQPQVELLVERHRSLATQDLEGALALGPRALPELG